LIEIGFHLTLLYHCRYNTQGQNPPACLLFDFGLLYGHTPVAQDAGEVCVAVWQETRHE
jgi:hypothetical protein